MTAAWNHSPSPGRVERRKRHRCDNHGRCRQICESDAVFEEDLRRRGNRGGMEVKVGKTGAIDTFSARGRGGCVWCASLFGGVFLWTKRNATLCDLVTHRGSVRENGPPSVLCDRSPVQTSAIVQRVTPPAGRENLCKMYLLPLKSTALNKATFC